MSFELRALLGGGTFPQIFKRGAYPKDALTLSYTGGGSATVSIDEDRMIGTTPAGAPGFSYDLGGGLTLADLVAAINGLGGGFAAALSDSDDGRLLALALVDQPAVDVGLDAVTFYRFTSTNWQVLKAIARELSEESARLDLVPPQLDLLEAAGFFADFWGTFTDTARKAGETDEDYTARQLHELLRPRENNHALANLIEEDTGEHVNEVRDLRPLIFRPSRTPLRGYFLPGRRYNTASFEVLMEGFPSAEIGHIVARDKAAGTKGYITGQWILNAVHSGFSLRVSTIFAAEIPPMQIGVTPIGDGRIGP